ncbi:MAG: alpha-E domain-containing protein [Rhodobiaceae bacterium]|nr:alpha-E domain-containing protein [Rhodobiaceae bacterium]
MLSRTADSLYWLARYIERAENLARILDGASRMAALPQRFSGGTNEWQTVLTTSGSSVMFHEQYDTLNRENVIDFLAFSPNNPSSIRSCFETARHNARAVRTALTTEMWDAINGAWLDMMSFDSNRIRQQEFARFLQWVKRSSLLVDGSAYRTMLRNDAYSFTRLGTFIERADKTARILDVKYYVLLPDHENVGGGLDYYQWTSILRSVSALTSYHWVYRDSIKPWLVAELLILRPEMPRSLMACYENITTHLEVLSDEYGRQGQAQRRARSVFAKLQNAHIDEVFSGGLHEFLSSFINENGDLANIVHEQYLS